MSAQPQPFKWIDLTGPTRAELDQLAHDHGLPTTLVQDCLEPDHLPKLEKTGDATFIILRSFDEKSGPDADTVQELTRKTAIFVCRNLLITIHRVELPFLKAIRDRWSDSKMIEQTLAEILKAALISYDHPIELAVTQLENLETKVFGNQPHPAVIEEGYYLKRRTFLMRRMIRLTQDLVAQLDLSTGLQRTLLQDVRETATRLQFHVEELTENVTSLLNLHLSLASHRTNEIVRLLTVLSVFFLPLNFITGLYGMNFEQIPGLKSHFGFGAALLVMIITASGILLWFKRRGWLR